MIKIQMEGYTSYLFMLVLIISTIGLGRAVLRTECGDYCDPNWTPFDNMVYGLQGYNIKLGNPIENTGDPGFTRQIFLPTKIDDRGRVALEDGITANGIVGCRRSFSSSSFSNMQSYRKFVETKSSSGWDLQLGLEADVTVGYKGASASTTIPPAFTSAWGNSRDFKKMEKLFKEQKGMVTVTMGECIMYIVTLDRSQFPPFTNPFIRALGKLYDDKDKPASIQQASFQYFIREYGTHFLLRSKFGAQYIARTKYTETARKQFDSNTLQKCSFKKGMEIFGTQVDSDDAGCSTNDENKINQLGRSDVFTEIITKGSRPTDIQDWATQEFEPVPLVFQLSPIPNLFQSIYIDQRGLTTRTKQPIVSADIRKWFLPLYYDFCNSMQMECGQNENGCGIDDECPIDTFCTGSGSVHKCDNWSAWTCTESCGQPNRQLRSRNCQGCEGETTKYRDAACKAQRRCPMKSEVTTKTKEMMALHQSQSHVQFGRTLRNELKRIYYDYEFVVSSYESTDGVNNHAISGSSYICVYRYYNRNVAVTYVKSASRLPQRAEKNVIMRDVARNYKNWGSNASTVLFKTWHRVTGEAARLGYSLASVHVVQTRFGLTGTFDGRFVSFYDNNLVTIVLVYGSAT